MPHESPRTDDVLVVDDDPDMAEIMTVVLHQAGYATRTADNGRQALDEVAQRKPALVLLDMLMPVMDGWECARRLRNTYGHSIPIVVVTAAEHVRARSDGLDVDDVLPKPFDIFDLLTVVARYADRSSGALA